MGQRAPVVPFTERVGVQGEDKYAAVMFRRIGLKEDDLNILFATFMKIKDHTPHRDVINAISISKHFDATNNADFLAKLFSVVKDFDSKKDTTNFKEFTLGLWNFLSLSANFIPALVFHLYDPLKINLIDMKELKDMLEAIHKVKLSPFTFALNNIMKEALMNNTDGGLNVEKFGIMCVDSPFIVKPIVALQQQLRKKIVGAAYWKKLEFRRSASIRGNLRNVNYVYIVNEETEIWRKKDSELGLQAAASEELDFSELFEIPPDSFSDSDRQEAEHAKLRLDKTRRRDTKKEEKRQKRQIYELNGMLEAFMKSLGNSSDEHKHQHHTSAQTKGKEAFDFAESFFMTAEGKLVGPDVSTEAAAVLEFPGGENFIFGVVTDNKNSEDTLVVINRDLSRRRVKGRDLGRINSNFNFVGYSKLSVKTLPGQLRVRPNLPLLELCNNSSLVPKLSRDGVYQRGKWNEDLRALVVEEAKTGDFNYLHEVAVRRKSMIEDHLESMEERHSMRWRRMLGVPSGRIFSHGASMSKTNNDR